MPANVNLSRGSVEQVGIAMVCKRLRKQDKCIDRQLYVVTEPMLGPCNLPGVGFGQSASSAARRIAEPPARAGTAR